MNRNEEELELVARLYNQANILGDSRAVRQLQELADNGSDAAQQAMSLIYGDEIEQD